MTLALTPVDRFRAAMRKLANSDGTAEDAPEDPTDQADTKKED